MGLAPGSVPPVGIFTPATYYWSGMLLYPVFELSRWLLMSALLHLALRLLGKASSFDAIPNIAGVTSIVIEPAVRA